MSRGRPFSFLFGAPKPVQRQDLPILPLGRNAEEGVRTVPAAAAPQARAPVPAPAVSEPDNCIEESHLPYTILPVRAQHTAQQAAPENAPAATPPPIGSVSPLPTRPIEAAGTVAPLISPVFIVGSPRSGTSILIDGLMAAGYTGYREGNFLTLMRIFDTAIDRHRQAFGQPTSKVLAGRIDWDAFKDEIFQVFKRQVEALNPASPWMDKTGNPEMIEAIPQLLNLWPNARFIYAKRRALENIVSRLIKFPEHTFDYHCRDWARNMTAWRAVREQLGPRGIEIDQQQIARTPHKVAQSLADFLRADAGGRERMQDTFMNDRPQQTDEGSTERVVSLESVGWTAPQREAFMRLCGPEMEQYGYSLNDTYWLAAGT